MPTLLTPKLKVGRSRVRASREVFVNDVHAPFQDHKSVNLFLEFLRDFKPNRVWIVGDLIDFYAISRYEKNPDRLLNIDAEVTAAKDVCNDIRQAVKPGTEIEFLPGNHDDRLQKFCWKHPEIAKLRGLQIDNVLELDRFRVNLRPKQVRFEDVPFLVEHGDICRKRGGYTAAAMLERRGMSGLSGHTHRLAGTRFTDQTGEKVWFENGCLCDLAPEYAVGAPDWQQGFSVGWFWPGGYHLRQVPIVRHRIYFGDRVYRVKS